MGKRRRGTRAGKKVQAKKVAVVFKVAAETWKAQRESGQKLRDRLRRLTAAEPRYQESA